MSVTFDQNMNLQSFAEAFGDRVDNFSMRLKERINSLDFAYRFPSDTERENLYLEALRKIKADKQKIGAPERTQVWQDGWNENLNMFRESDYDESALRPKFVRKGNPVRLNKKFIIPRNNDFELNFIEIFRHWYIETYFSDIEEVHEFGCGTGFNLLAINKLFSEKKLYGSDFVQSSVDLVNTIASSKSIPLKGTYFNMLEPRSDYKVGPSSALYTFGSLEQLASKIEPILDFFVAKRPAICLHCEPAIELYDDDSIVDLLGYQFQKQRGYTSGLIRKLKELESEEKIEILKIKRLFFGSFFMEGYNLFVWRPVK